MIKKVIVKSMGTPATNKWTKMHPAMCQTTLMTCFFKIVQHGLEAKTRTTYEELAASGVAEEEHGDGQDEKRPKGIRTVSKRPWHDLANDV